MAGEPHQYRLEGFAAPDQLDHVHALLERAGREHPEIDPIDLMLFDTAVIEIANNVVEHGRPRGKVRWRLTVSIGEAEIVADLYDSAQPADVAFDTAMPEADADSGRGLPLACALLDELTVTREPGANRWRMVRHLARQ
ncbi:serine/threonine-protein kinase RsbW [Nocardioides sp. YR527]|uniref:ATP-binding protein n=1 Tax=Nocardioides sp. YR527 TaxID=1881028 RepID=UPI000888EDEB|nr:ATP-binding protein [Nocardioides sp. YR527]SDK73791.1 serine/threonine-protein kinase RsbW [Nocardioides sp. YR527]